MYKFAYPVNEHIDLNEISDKASSLFIKRCMVNRYTSFKSVSDYYDCMDSIPNEAPKYHHSVLMSHRQILVYNICYHHSNARPLSYGGIQQSHMDDMVKQYDNTVMHNVYLGCHNDRIYVIMGSGKIDGIHTTIIESFPIDLLRASYTKEYYNDNYTTFERIFNQRTITVVNSEKTFTYIPSKITKSPRVKSLGISKSIDSFNLSSIIFDVRSVSCSEDYELSLSTGFNKIVHSTFTNTLSRLVDIVGGNIVSKLLKRLNDDGEVDFKQFGLDKTFTEFFSISLPDDDIKDLTKHLETVGVELFDDSKILIDNSIEFCLSLYGFSEVSLVSSLRGMFVKFDDFMNESNVDHINGFPYGRLLRHPEFNKGDLVHIVVDDGDICQIEYTTLGERVVGDFMDDNEKLLYDLDIDRNDVNRRLLTLNYYMSQKFFREVVHTAWFNKDSIKDMMKRCSYVAN